MDHNVEDCPVCFITFDDTLRRPRTLPCGHTFCTPCIDGLKQQGQVTCPTCRTAHTLPEDGQFPVCYIAEAMIRSMRGAVLSSPPPKAGKDTTDSPTSAVTGLGRKGPAGLSRKVQSLLQEQEANVLAAIGTCQELLAQLSQYQVTLAGWGERQQHLEDQLQALVDRSKGARLLVKQEESVVVAKKEEVHQGEQQLHVMLQVLRTVATRQEAYEVIDDADQHTEEQKQRARECLEMFPDVQTVTTISKVREASSAALEAAATIQADHETVGNAAAGAAGAAAAAAAAAPGDSSPLAGQTSSISDRLQALLSPLTLRAEDLRTLTQPARNLLQDGLVFATHNTDGPSRHARITLDDNCRRLYLHHLQDQSVPSAAVTLQMEEVVPATPPCLVFLDLAWPGTAPRRVVIRLNPDTPRGRQFVLLCTGQQGPTYANTRLLKVWDKGRPGECVMGGDYQYGDGRGGAALLPHLDEGDYRKSRLAGAVWGWWLWDPARGAQFGITTRDWREGDGGAPHVIGEVVEGLDGVAAAAQHSNIEEVTVVDCGVVLWA